MSLNPEPSISIQYQNFAEAIERFANPTPNSANEAKPRDEGAGL